MAANKYAKKSHENKGKHRIVNFYFNYLPDILASPKLKSCKFIKGGYLEFELNSNNNKYTYDLARSIVIIDDNGSTREIEFGLSYVKKVFDIN